MPRLEQSCNFTVSHETHHVHHCRPDTGLAARDVPARPRAPRSAVAARGLLYPAPDAGAPGPARRARLVPWTSVIAVRSRARLERWIMDLDMERT